MFGIVEYSWYFIDIGEVATILLDCDDIPTEAETRSQLRRRRAVVTRRLVTWAGIARVPFASSSHERSPELLEAAFVNGRYQFRWEYSCGVP